MQDVIIIGAGPAGLSLACSLSNLGLQITVIEKQSEDSLANPTYDGRETALTHFSKHLMQQMGAWQRIGEDKIQMVREAKVIDGESPYAMHFDYREVCDDTLGYIISNHNIRKSVYEEAKTHKNINLICDESVDTIHTDAAMAEVKLNNGERINAALIVAADSRFSNSRRTMGISTSMKDFGKVAIVCKAKHELEHNDTAYECFRYGGTLAILPLPNKESSIVITVSAEKAEAILAQSPEEFSADVTAQFNNRFGKMELSSELCSYPLVATYADKFFAKRFALVGDAAVGMHPVTAHGFNLGLKGQDILAKQMKSAIDSGMVFFSDAVLNKYDSKLRVASKPLYMATNALVQLYTDERPLPKLLRKAVLRIGNTLTPAKKAIMHQLTEIKDVA